MNELRQKVKYNTERSLQMTLCTDEANVGYTGWWLCCTLCATVVILSFSHVARAFVTAKLQF